MSQITMEKPQRGQKLLRDEVNHLKTQKTLVMEILLALLRKEGNLVPAAVAKMVTHVHLPDSISCHELSHKHHP